MIQNIYLYTYMDFQLFSDIHIETLRNNFPKIKNKSKLLILAGDIGNINSKLYIKFIEYISNNWEHIIYILGNHEYYSLTDKIQTVNEMKTSYNNLFEQYPNIHLLDNDVFEYNDYVFIGTTLWSFIPNSSRNITKSFLNDFYQIYISNKENINIDYYNDLHTKSLDFLIETTKKYSNKKIIIITHHSPYPNNTSNPKYEGLKTNCAFSSDIINKFNDDNIIMWIFGHTHWCCDFTINNIRLISNQKGYNAECLTVGKYKVDGLFHI